jgi:hypothetical protein
MMAGAGWPAFRIKARGQASALASLARRGLLTQAQSNPCPSQGGQGSRCLSRSSMLCCSRPSGETGRPGQPANQDAALDRLIEALLEPEGRQARRKAAEAIEAGLRGEAHRAHGLEPS